jgi:insulysin
MEAAGMVIGAGAVMDGGVYGLAHFTEHMLFLGSKKYNNATYFVDFVTLRHGAHNGRTKVDSSMFYFKIEKEHFLHAFDIFSRFFIDPIFNSTFIEKEINSVNSEYQKNLQLDNSKKDHVFRALSHPNSFYHRFRTGNNYTLLEYSKLNNLNLTTLVENYFKEYYVPNNMKLVIIGSKNIAYYKNLVENTFGHLKYKNFNKIKEESSPFEFYNLGYMTFYQTIKEAKELDINFVIPQKFFAEKNIPDYNINNPALYFKFLIDQRVNGSLYEYFRANGYITGIKSRLKNFYPGLTVFTITILLTDKGIIDLNKIINGVLSFIEFIREEAISNKDLYNLVKLNYDNKFYNATTMSNIFNSIKEICNSITDYPDKYILAKHKLLGEYNPDILNEFANYLTLNNSIILFGDRNFEKTHLYGKYSSFLDNFDEKLILLEHEKWMNTFYGKYKIKEEIIQEGKIEIDNEKIINEAQIKNGPINLTKIIIEKDLENDEITGNTEEYHFGLEDYFKLLLPKNLPMKQLNLCSNKKCKNEMKNDETDLKPEILLKNNLTEVWFKVNYFILHNI